MFKGNNKEPRSSSMGVFIVFDFEQEFLQWAANISELL